MNKFESSILDSAIERAFSAIWDAQHESGYIDGRCHGGPLYSAVALITKAQVGCVDAFDHQRVLPWMFSQQRSDGSFVASPDASEGSLDATALVYAAGIAMGVGEDAGVLRNARVFIEAHGGFAAVNAMYAPTLAIAGVVSVADLPRALLLLNLVPFSRRLLSRFVNQWVGMSATIIPAIIRGLVDQKEGVPWYARGLRAHEKKRALDLLQSLQNPNGSLSGVLLFTAQLINVYQVLGVDQDADCFRTALAALDRFRMSNQTGGEYMPFTAEVWNTAQALRSAVKAGLSPELTPVRKMVAWLLEHQTTQDAPRLWQNPAPNAPRSGGWPFQTANVRNPDCDTTATVLHALGAYADSNADTDVRDVVNRGVAWLLPMQNPDGGWPSMTRNNGEKSPGPFSAEAMAIPTRLVDMGKLAFRTPPELQDPSTAAMTGRILSGLAACGVTISHPAIRRCLGFMEDQQWEDRYWGRWEVNFVAGTAFAVLGMIDIGIEPNDDMVRRPVRWLETQQNEDGGWGEGVETYRRPLLEKNWPSRADLTGKVLKALIAANGPECPYVTRGVTYLLQTQQEDGLWNNDDGQYVIVVPDLFYVNPFSNQTDALEGLVEYRRVLRSFSRSTEETDWSDAKLDAMRLEGDRAADEVIRVLFTSGEVAETNHFFRRLMSEASPMPDGLPPIVQDYFHETQALPEFCDPRKIQVAQRVFAAHGVSIVTALFCSSLPHAYAAHRGARVLMMTGRMSGDFTRRIVETAQFVMDVLEPGSLDNDGEGVRTTQKVRLIHAAIRHMISRHPEWQSEEWGVPINQEDLAGTLLTFSTLVIRALETMRVTLSEEEIDGYFHLWRCVGFVLGVNPDMIPKSPHDADRLMRAIQRRQFGASEQGRLLTAALIEAMESYVPGEVFDGSAAVYIRHLIGDELADQLAVPSSDWTKILYDIETNLARVFENNVDESDVLTSIFGHFSRAVMNGLSLVYRDGKDVGFRIPEQLAKDWDLATVSPAKQSARRTRPVRVRARRRNVAKDAS